jgi:hypothetical protein
VVVSGIIAEYGVDGLFMCTVMAGILLVVMGLTGTGVEAGRGDLVLRPVVGSPRDRLGPISPPCSDQLQPAPPRSA